MDERLPTLSKLTEAMFSSSESQYCYPTATQAAGPTAKYFSITSPHLKKYVDVPDAIATAAQVDADEGMHATTAGAPKRRLGPPKPQKVTLKPDQPSILQPAKECNYAC
ncbi:unnamed protein product [Phytophthora fragariaefolia]|uniref:Unnamed protein product n=1 Tax=Phytophthora fragariaefolia TaxID=1490495 RepID=A0A9W6WZL8_9STRA|nr:unnamed protein product [Phytophthora fragariaefolia]